MSHPTFFKRAALAATISLILHAPILLAEDALLLPTLVVDGELEETLTENTESYTIPKMDNATKLNLSLKETPQSISVITRSQMDDFSLTNLKSVLHNATGINVVEVETDRTSYNARGFEIQNILVDGLGLPLSGDLLHGDIDTAIYDHIEILRGANALLTGVGNPSATINQVRKRPTNEFQASANVTLGSWNKRRVDTDISGSFNESIRGRLVAVKEKADSYIDRYATDKTTFYGVIEADLSHNTLLTLGYSQQDTDADGSISGGLPLFYSNGQATNYDRSTSSAPDWAFWNTEDSRAFVELSHNFANDWTAKATISRIESDSDSEQMYLYWPSGVNPVTELGALVYTGSYTFEKEQDLIDIYASGPFNLAGREHELMLGLSWSKSEMKEKSLYDIYYSAAFTQDLNSWNGSYPKGEFNNDGGGSAITDKQKSVYAAARFDLHDSFKLIAGSRLSTWQSSGSSYGTDVTTSHNAVLTPYLGLVYDVNDNVSIYSSYTEVFSPQAKVDVNRKRLAPKDGINYELGIKGEFFDNKLNTSFAIFQTEQNNVAEAAGTLPGGDTYYKAIDGVTSKGFEFDLSGELTENLQLSAGYTHLKITDEANNKVNAYIPRKTFNSSASYRIPSMQKLKIGASVNWQSKISRDEGNGITSSQTAYTLVNLMANYDINEQFKVSFNANNISDKKYLTTMQYSQSHYGAPRHYMLSLHWSY
ncbi:MAG: TonB-dependent siderophore receptor [Gammaproteobacteria bacterium]|nr:MAG: TonB-dependent siderophore receptor [Gammaproteobacteria bacterium]